LDSQVARSRLGARGKQRRPIAPVVLHALKELTISARGADRFPQQCTVDDLAGADFVVAVKETEHRPLMRDRFVEWEHRLDYWNVHFGDAAPAEALKLLAREVRTLLLRLRGPGIVMRTRWATNRSAD
jgi:protein-tyrosine-phosphatase